MYVCRYVLEDMNDMCLLSKDERLTLDIDKTLVVDVSYKMQLNRQFYVKKSNLSAQF